MTGKQTLQILRVSLYATQLAAVFLAAIVTYGLSLEIAANPLTGPNGSYASCGIGIFAVSPAVQHDVESIMTLIVAIAAFLIFSTWPNKLLVSRRDSALAMTPLMVHALCAFFFNNFGGLGSG